ncbi:unnamed protein product [Sphagnum troendelagicum]|uniref:Uncharacterized protein n=1 Tax=Sphagnum troendelagicum TaxID=128251 RepID=A0ABP0UJW5_9BRYO
MFDGVRLMSMLDEYNYLRQEKDEEKRRLRDQKKIQEQLITEYEALFGSKPSGRSAAAVVARRGEQQQKVVQAPALRSPVVMCSV